MRLPFDTHHLEMPAKVVFAIISSVSSVMVAAWQALGELVAQIPTPEQMIGWRAEQVYLWAAILFAGGIVYMGRWIVVRLLGSLDASTASQNNMAAALNAFTDKVDGLVMDSVQHAMKETFTASNPMGGVLSSAQKRRTQPPE